MGKGTWKEKENKRMEGSALGFFLLYLFFFKQDKNTSNQNIQIKWNKMVWLWVV